MRGRLVLVAGVVSLLLGGCATGTGASHRETCDELWAEHKSCPPVQWHEENEGPSVYNHFHSTQE